MSEYGRWEKAVELPVELIDPDPRNPNVMSDTKFSKLVSRIEKYGFDEPIQVIPNPEDAGRYLIVGGEHRYKAARILSMATIPAVVKEHLQDEVERYTELMARNIDRGDLDTAKFNKLLDHINRTTAQPFTNEQLADRMGFGDIKEFEKHLKKEKKKTEQAVESAKESSGGKTQIIDNVSYVLNEVMNKFGETVPKGYIFFCYKNRMHLMVQCDKDLYQLTHDVAEGTKRDNKEINEVLKGVFGEVKAQGGFGEAPVDFEYSPDADDDLDDLDSPKNLLK
jgi:ParB/RepB/Spo0J family partition protein